MDSAQHGAHLLQAKSLVREMERISTSEYANKAKRVDSLKWIVGVEDFLRVRTTQQTLRRVECVWDSSVFGGNFLF